jgi:glutathione S-transferase
MSGMSFPSLGFPSDEKVVAHALPKIEVGLKVAERELAHGKEYLLGSELTLADFYLLPSTYSFNFAPEAKTMYPKYPGFSRWRERMEGLPTVKKLRAALPPRAPIEHAREWAVSHRPKYLRVLHVYSWHQPQHTRLQRGSTCFGEGPHVS